MLNEKIKKYFNQEIEVFKKTNIEVYNGLNNYHKKEQLLNYFTDSIKTLMARQAKDGTFDTSENRVKKLVKDCFDLYVTIFNVQTRNKNESPMAKYIREDTERKIKALDDTTKGIFRDEYEEIKDFVLTTDRSTLNEQEATKLQEFKPK